jgi:hypothetical protein
MVGCGGYREGGDEEKGERVNEKLFTGRKLI